MTTIVFKFPHNVPFSGPIKSCQPCTMFITYSKIRIQWKIGCTPKNHPNWKGKSSSKPPLFEFNILIFQGVPDFINIHPLHCQRFHQETATARFHALVDVTSTTTAPARRAETQQGNCRSNVWFHGILGVSKNRGARKWMVHNGKPY